MINVALRPGTDPFDALRGRRVPSFVRAHPRLRQAAIQIRKRWPIDLSGVLDVRPFVMSKALGCFLAAEARMVLCGSGEESRLEALAAALMDSEGHVGDGAWSYEFDVQTRWGYYRSCEPNLIAIVFVGKGFLEAGLVAGREEWVNEAVACARYLRSRMFRTVGGGARPSFAYHEKTEHLIHNANLLGAGFCAAVGQLTGSDDMMGAGAEAAMTSVDSLRNDHTLPYGDAPRLSWTDNFHTAYGLDGLNWVSQATGHEGVRAALPAAVVAWREGFFGPAGEPYYTRERHHPLDIHSAGTGVDVAGRLASSHDLDDLPERVGAWTEDNLVDERTGLTFYQVHRGWTDRRNFRRWGDASWALARSTIALRAASMLAPVEARLSEARGAGPVPT